jgi:hypothetical protein
MKRATRELQTVTRFAVIAVFAACSGGSAPADAANDVTADTTVSLSDGALDVESGPANDGASDSMADTGADAMADSTSTDVPGVVGDPCTSNADCASGTCLREADYSFYPGGYCTVRNCMSDGGSCPSGSRCLGGGAIGSTGCFADCSPTQSCRGGYRCFAVDDAGSAVCWRSM